MRGWNYHIYIVSGPSRTLDTGVGNYLKRRIWQHETTGFRRNSSQPEQKRTKEDSFRWNR
jgi:hypothetical protein